MRRTSLSTLTGVASLAAVLSVTVLPGVATAASAASASTGTSATTQYVNPLAAGTTTSCYGQRWGVLHAGVDLAAAEGTDILAVAAGTVIAAGWNYSGYGISVVIDHGDGYYTHYAHMNATSVTAGQQVAAGAVLGQEGSTGDSTGPHLHFEVHEGSLWNQIDPAPWLAERGIETGC
ncbi:MAG: M23 family metallopeptidase [Hamadaea sp.]|nr:M23 family metallopeptidase [Hamadaea sp.]